LVFQQLCITNEFRKDIAVQLHDNNNHICSDRLYATSRSKYYWPGMYIFLHDHVMTCLTCQMVKGNNNPKKTPVGALPVVPPGERWVADFHGPFPVSNKDKRYTLVFIDSASLWPQMVATADTSAETVVQALFECVISRYGFPKETSLQTDNGSGFIARLTALCCKTFGIKQYFSTPYHPQPQTKVERFAKTIHQPLKVLCTKLTDYSQHLAAVSMSYRGSKTVSLGTSPHEILFARPFRFAIDWSLATPDAVAGHPESYAQQIRPKLEILSYLAMENSDQSATKQRQRVNENAKIPTFQIGDKVLLHNPVTRKGDSAKLTIRYTGPYLITDSDAQYNYRLQSLATGMSLKRPVHCGRLKAINELDNDYRVERATANRPLYDGIAPSSGITIHVRVGDPLASQASALVVYVDGQLQPISEDGARIIMTAGARVVERLDYARSQRQDTDNYWGRRPPPYGQNSTVTLFKNR